MTEPRARHGKAPQRPARKRTPTKRTPKKRTPKKKKRRRRGFRLTREGKVFLAVCLGVGLAAVNTGNNLLYLVLGLMLSLLLVSGTLSDLVLWKLSVKRHLPRRLFAGIPMAVELELHNRKARVPSYALELVDLARGETDAPRRCFFLKVSADTKQRAVYRRAPAKRGWLDFEEVVLRSRHPFGLIEKSRHRACPDRALVFPALVPVVLAEIPGMSSGREEIIDAPGRGADVRGVRDFREGDEARAIHWRRSAALDRFVVRERSREGRGHLALLLDQARPDDAGEPWHESFEHRISRAASLARAALAEGFAVEVFVRGGRSPEVRGGASPDPIFRYLALLDSVAAADAGDFPPVPHGSLVHGVQGLTMSEAAQ